MTLERHPLRTSLWIAIFVCSTPALALSRRVYVSAKIGSDANACTTVAAPCRTVTKALAKVSAGGEIVILQSGDYDAFSITKAVTIEAAPGIYAGVTAPQGQAAVTVNVAAFDTVNLVGLTLRNGGAGNNGITAASAGLLTVDRCVIDGFAAGDGISLQNGYVDVRDSVLRFCAVGLHFFTSCSICAPSSGTVERTRFEGNGNAALVDAGARAAIRNSVATQNGVGFAAQGDVPTELNLESCLISENRSDGIHALGAATVRVSDCAVTGNASVGLFQEGVGVVLSRRNNTVEGNGVDTQGHIAFYAPR
jgi:hypothetical protein